MGIVSDVNKYLVFGVSHVCTTVCILIFFLKHNNKDNCREREANEQSSIL